MYRAGLCCAHKKARAVGGRGLALLDEICYTILYQFLHRLQVRVLLVGVASFVHIRTQRQQLDGEFVAVTQARAREHLLAVGGNLLALFTLWRIRHVLRFELLCDVCFGDCRAIRIAAADSALQGRVQEEQHRRWTIIIRIIVTRMSCAQKRENEESTSESTHLNNEKWILKELPTADWIFAGSCHELYW